MKDLTKIAKKILSKNSVLESFPKTSDSYFDEPSRGKKDYFSFNEFNDKEELSQLLKEYLSDLDIANSDLKKLSELAYKLKESDGENSDDLSDFIYAMS